MVAAKLLLSLVIAFIWGRLVFANIAAAGRTAASMQTRLGIVESDARRRTTKVVLAWTAALTAMAVIALVKIW